MAVYVTSILYMTDALSAYTLHKKSIHATHILYITCITYGCGSIRHIYITHDRCACHILYNAYNDCRYHVYCICNGFACQVYGTYDDCRYHVYCIYNGFACQVYGTYDDCMYHVYCIYNAFVCQVYGTYDDCMYHVYCIYITALHARYMVHMMIVGTMYIVYITALHARYMVHMMIVHAPRDKVAQWIRCLDYLATHTSLSPIRRGFVPGFVNYKKGALDSQLQVIKFSSCLPMVGGSLRVLRLIPPLKLVAMI